MQVSVFYVVRTVQIVVLAAWGLIVTDTILGQDRMGQSGEVHYDLDQKLKAIQTCRQLIFQVQSSTRGYIMTGDSTFLLPFQEAQAAWSGINAALVSPLPITADTLSEDLLELADQVSNRLFMGADIIRIYHADGPEVCIRYIRRGVAEAANTQILATAQSLEQRLLTEKKHLMQMQAAIMEQSIPRLWLIVLLPLMVLLLTMWRRDRNQHIQPPQENPIHTQDLMRITGELAHVGGWDFTLSTSQIRWSPQVYMMLEESEPYSEVTLLTCARYLDPQVQVELARTAQDIIQARMSETRTISVTTGAGRRKWLRVSARPVIEGDRVIALQGAVQDVTADMARESALEASQKELIFTSERLARHNQELDNFAYTISHNMRSAIANITALTDLAIENSTPEILGEVLPRLHRITASLDDTIRSMISQLEGLQEDENSRERVLLQDSFDRVRGILERQMQNTQAQITTDFDEASIVWYNPAYLDSIFLNLLSNALKYKHPDRIPEIRVSGRMSAQGPELVVEDNGVGIDLAMYRQQIFGYRKTFHGHPDATGLGLFLIRNQVEAMGGTIRVESTPGIGTVFYVTLGLSSQIRE
ncbi:MAG: ATP-binding protein [Bacteroidia bacterium]|nr:ATP-binding protein [Bacteroidia bacterium]